MSAVEKLSYSAEEIAIASREEVELVTGDRASKLKAIEKNRRLVLLNAEIREAGKNMTKHLKEKALTQKAMEKCVNYIFRREEKRKAKLLKEREKVEKKAAKEAAKLKAKEEKFKENELKKLLKKRTREVKKAAKLKEKKKKKQRLELLKMIQKMKSLGADDLKYDELVSLNSINDRILAITMED